MSLTRMFHLFHWRHVTYWNQSYIDNGSFGIQVVYDGIQQEGTFFLAPQIDLNNQVIRYFAFDSRVEQERFENVLKIQWVWWKTAHQLALLPVDELKQAIETFDLKYFQSIKWIGPKTAKRILVEMKHTLKDNDLIKLQGDQQAIKNIVSSLVGLWYQKSAIQELLKQYDEIISKDTLPVVMKRLIDRL